MSIKFRGNSQIKDESIGLDKLQDLTSGKILGRSSGSDSGAPNQISDSNFTSIAELSSSDSVEFSGITGSSLDLSTTLTVANNATFNSNLVIEGDLTVEHQTTEINVSSLSIDDPMIYLAKGNVNNAIDIGIFGSYSETSGGSSDGDDLSDGWTDASGTSFTDGGIDYNFGSEYSSSYGGSAKLCLPQYYSGASSSSRSRTYKQFNATGDNLSQSGTYVMTATVNYPDVNGGSFTGRLSIWNNGLTHPFGNNGKSYQSFNQSTSSGSDVTLNFTSDSNIENGLVMMLEGWTGSSNLPNNFGLYFSYVKITDPNGTIIFEQDGFDGEGGSETTTNYHTGIFRDNSTSSFHLFKTTEEVLSTTEVDKTHNTYSKSTLVSDIEGDISFATDRTFSLSGDLSGSALFSGNNSPTISSTIQNNSVQLDNIDFFIDEDDMSSDSDVKIPSQQSVKAYVDSQVSAGGFSDIQVADIKIVSETSTGVYEFVKAKNIIEHKTASSSDVDNGYLNVTTEIESEFESLSKVYLNGQKLRFSSDEGSSNDYWFSSSSSAGTEASATRHDNALTASDAANKDMFGTGVGLSNDGLVLAVGAGRWEGSLTDQGGVYIYDWNSDNEEWDQRGSVITAPDAEASDRFGESTSLNSDGTIMATGALLWDGEVTYQGAVYAFEYSNGSWSQKGSTLSHDNPTTSDLFTHVSISGNGLVLSVGVYGYNGSTGADQGAVYVYDWNASSNDWDQRGSILLPSDPATSDYFGRDTSLNSDGSVLAVGSAYWEGDTTNQGAVYIYDWADTDSDGTADAWVQRGNVLETAATAASGDQFGFSCQLNNDASILAVSKYQYSNGGGDEGEVELYDWNSGTSSWDLRLTISNPYPSSSGTKNQYAFGYKLSIDGDGDVLVISERGTGYNNFAGRVQTYTLTEASSGSEGSRNKLNFNSGVVSEDDNLEIRYIVKSDDSSSEEDDGESNSENSGTGEANSYGQSSVTSGITTSSGGLHMINYGGNPVNGDWDDLNGIDGSTHIEFGPIGPTQTSGFSVDFANSELAANSIWKAMDLASVTGYEIGDWELWGHANASKSYSFYSETREPDHENLGWVLISSGNSTGTSIEYNMYVGSEADYFTFDDNETIYNSYMLRFKHTGATTEGENVKIKTFLPFNAARSAPTYTLSATPNTIEEGNSFTVTLDTTNVLSGRRIAYTISGGLASEDYTIGPAGLPAQGGYFDIAGDTASFTMDVISDALHGGDETVTVSLDNGLATLDIVIQNNPNNDDD